MDASIEVQKELKMSLTSIAALVVIIVFGEQALATLFLLVCRLIGIAIVSPVVIVGYSMEFLGWIFSPTKSELATPKPASKFQNSVMVGLVILLLAGLAYNFKS